MKSKAVGRGKGDRQGLAPYESVSVVICIKQITVLYSYFNSRFAHISDSKLYQMNSDC